MRTRETNNTAICTNHVQIAIRAFYSLLVVGAPAAEAARKKGPACQQFRHRNGAAYCPSGSNHDLSSLSFPRFSRHREMAGQSPLKDERCAILGNLSIRRSIGSFAASLGQQQELASKYSLLLCLVCVAAPSSEDQECGAPA